MNKILLFLLFSSFIYAKMWQHQHRFNLKKDELAQVLLLQSTDGDFRDSFDFSWTLWDTQKITVHSKYRKFPRQHTLYLKRGLDSYAQDLLPQTNNAPFGRARLMLVFDNFDEKEKIATFDVYIEDENKRLTADFIEPKR